MANSVNIMIVRQLDAINRSMERHERKERHEKRKKRERRKRQRAKGKATHWVMQAALEDLDDHGGKGAGFFR